MDPMDRQKEESLLRKAVLSGDESAWQLLYERHFDALYRFVERRTAHNSQLTEEVVQECWLIAVRRIQHFQPKSGRFLSWLFGIAKNVLRNEWRRSGKSVAPGCAACYAEQGSAENQKSGEVDLTELIDLTFAALPATYEAVLRAKYERDLTVAQIATSWERTPKSIESLLARARIQFRAVFEGLRE